MGLCFKQWERVSQNTEESGIFLEETLRSLFSERPRNLNISDTDIVQRGWVGQPEILFL